jgi:Lrp/AsnC family transcriptional regulator, regulator for asnA, asnC and gidA
MDGVSSTDLDLVRCLLESPRASYAELARQTGVSETTAKRRVEALIEDGVIKPALIPDVRRLGFQTMAIVGVKVDLNQLDEVARAISELPQVTSIHMTLGRYDVMATIAERSLEQLTETIAQELASVTGVREVETFVSTRALKILHNWRLPEPNGQRGEDEESPR